MSVLQNKLNNLIPPEIYPIANKDKNPVSNYLSFPDDVKLDNYENKIYFTEINNTYLAISPINKDLVISSKKKKKKNNSRLILKNKQKLGTATGFILEIGEKKRDKSFNWNNLAPEL